MKNSVNLHSLCFVILVIILHSCKKEELPTLSTSSISNIQATSATGGGMVTSDGNASVTARGICWGLNTNPTISDSKTNDGAGAGQFVSSLTSLSAGSTYHVRAYATNSVGTAYGADLSFATLGKAPECLSQAATNVTSSGATLNGIVNANYLSTTVSFEYGISTSYGQSITSAQSPVTGNSITNVNADLSGLTPGTTYHYRVVAVNSIGTTNGNDLSFTTGAVLPMLTTTLISNRTATTLTTGGNITSDGGAAITAKGVCWATTPNPTINDFTTGGTGIGTFISNIAGLTPNTIYYIRAYATNIAGTAYGNELYFITDPIIVADADGNNYNVIRIGNQLWIKENLKTTTYNDGTAILNVTDNSSWADLSSPAFCWYNNDFLYKSTYGALYNWYVVNTGKLCPIGWHVPTDTEWKVLEMYLGMTQAHADNTEEWRGTDQGLSLKSYPGWYQDYDSKYGTNTSGFSALPSGLRSYNNGGFYGVSYSCHLWSSGGSTTYPYVRILAYNYGSVFRGNSNSKNGFSVRCLKSD
jgi:uncharacterized protein (TIGR02145 family)